MDFNKLWENEYQPGQQVKIINPWYKHQLGRKGKVKRIAKGQYRPVIVSMENGDECTFTFWDLEKVIS